MKALKLLQTNTSTQERAENYVKSIKRNIQKKVLDPLIEKREQISDEILNLQDLSLATDINAGIKQLTQKECEERFTKIIDLKTEYELQGVILELKQKWFDHYFKETEDDENSLLKD